MSSPNQPKKSAHERVLESTEFVLQNADYVKVGDRAAIQRAAKEILDGIETKGYSTASWKAHTLHPTHADDAAAEWIFLLDLLNFSFWSDDPNVPFTVAYRGTDYHGYWSLCASMNRALDDGIPIYSAQWMQSVNEGTLTKIFRSETTAPIPMFKERLDAVRSAGKTLMERFNGSFVNVIKEAAGSAQALIELVLTHFPTFNDTAQYKGKTVYLYKRVQILVADLWACFEGTGLGAFHDIDTLTMFADYRVPQSLVHLGVLSYSDELRVALKDGELLAPGDPREVEIRAGSIWSVELVHREIKRAITETADANLRARASQINSVLIDFYLWDYAKAHSDTLRDVPVHCTRGIYY